MMKRCLSLLLVVGLIAVLAVPVSADEGNAGGWFEVLEVTSIRPDGANWFNIDGTTGNVSIPLPVDIRLCKIDLLFTHTATDPVTSVKISNQGSSQNLNLVKLDNYTTRVYGNISVGYYKSLDLIITKTLSSKASLQLLSCKVSSMSTTDYRASGYLYRDLNDSSPLPLPNNFSVSPSGALDSYVYKLIPVRVTDWRKFDYITIFGSFNSLALSSFRASIGTKGLPYTITYIEAIQTGSESYTDDYWWMDGYSTTTYYDYDSEVLRDESNTHTDATIAGSSQQHEFINYGGAGLFTITIDLTGIDRTVSGNMDCYFTCIGNPGLGYAFNVQDVSGSVITADTSSVSWWNRFTSFMTDLFGGDDPGALDDLGSSSDSISQNTSQISDFEHSQQAVLDNNFAQIQGAISFTNFAAALVFVQKYTNMTFNGISKYAIVFTLPLFLGLFFYLCSRIPGITRWKTPPPRSPSPKSKGGGKT